MNTTPFLPTDSAALLTHRLNVRIHSTASVRWALNKPLQTIAHKGDEVA